jgi:hypothetical protein
MLRTQVACMYVGILEYFRDQNDGVVYRCDGRDSKDINPVAPSPVDVFAMVHPCLQSFVTTPDGDGNFSKSHLYY